MRRGTSVDRRTGIAARLLAALVVGLLVAGSVPVLAQEDEEFPGPDEQMPLAGHTRSDGTVVLSDESFCRLLLGTIFGDRKLTYARLIDKSKQQKKARKAAFSATDEASVSRCTELLVAYRTEGPEDAATDPLAAWLRRAPVVPEAIAALLPPDFVAKPLAQPEAIGSAARTSGFGDVVTAPFSMTPGTWLAELDARTCDDWSGTLRDSRDQENAVELTEDRAYLHDLAGGHYFWDVTAPDCDWSVDLVPVVLGPEPTPTPEPKAIVPALFGPAWDPSPDNPNPDFLTAAEAREAVFEAGLVPDVCHSRQRDQVGSDRVWKQAPAAGSVVDFGTTVEVWMTTDCDIYLGQRVVPE